MEKLSCILVVMCILQIEVVTSYSQVIQKQNSKTISVEWQNERPNGIITVQNGKLAKIEVKKGKGVIKADYFKFISNEISRIDITFDSIQVDLGSGATIVNIKTETNPFSFFLRDVNRKTPIYIPEYKVIVLEKEDNRSFSEIDSEIKAGGLLTKLQKIEKEPEETYDSVSKYARNQPCPIWLGLSRDMRIFEISNSYNSSSREMELIMPRMASSSMKHPEVKDNWVQYSYVLGRGQGVTSDFSRRLEDGILPILHSTLIDDEIKYQSVAFVSFETSPLNEKTLSGTHFLVAENFSSGRMFTKEQEELLKPRLKEDEESGKKEATVLYFRTKAVNTSSVPRYAWFKTLQPGEGWWRNIPYTFDKQCGFSKYSSESVYCISKLNGKPLSDQEIAVLIQPGDSAVFEFYLPHNTISNERAIKLAQQSFETRYFECKKFWQKKLKTAAQIHVPEKRIDEMIQTGLLHLDLITYGNEPSGTLAPSIGVYSPIGTESAPIIQFYNSMGLHDIARRSLMFFLDMQHEDGFIQNFGGYMIETGAALWSMGEYFRYTNDTGWAKQVKPKLLKSCEYIIKWREKNKIENLHGKGYGMIDGKVADPEDNFHQYMLNGYAYLGLIRIAEILASIDPGNSIKLKKEAEAFKQDIRKSFFNSMANSPVVPLGDGSWCPTVPPWTEMVGPRALYVKPEKFFSHATFTVPDVLLGPLYLVFCEVLNPEEQAAKMLLNYQSELFLLQNSAFSQPYYYRNAWVELKTGLVKPFLKGYYNRFSSLADKEIYTFWEHVFKVSVHKTHEEAWFLMETRWMLYLEEGKTLKLLSGIPRKWMEDGKQINIKNAASYFGNFSLKVNSNLNNDFIDAQIECSSDRAPQTIIIRLPHPEGKKPIKVTGGTYDYKNETVKIESFKEIVNIRLYY